MNHMHQMGFRAALAVLLCWGLDACVASADQGAEPVAGATAVAKSVDESRAAQTAAMARINDVAAKVEARKQAIVAENEAAAKINGEIENLAKDLQKITDAINARQAELDKLIQADSAMAELQREMAAAYDALRAAREAGRKQRLKAHREHLMLPPAGTNGVAGAKSGEGAAK